MESEKPVKSKVLMKSDCSILALSCAFGFEEGRVVKLDEVIKLEGYLPCLLGVTSEETKRSDEVRRRLLLILS